MGSPGLSPPPGSGAYPRGGSQAGIADGIILVIKRNAADHARIRGGFGGKAIQAVITVSGGGGSIGHAGQEAREIVRGSDGGYW